MDTARIREAEPKTSAVVPYKDRKKDDKIQGALNQDYRQWTIKGLPPETVEVSREAAKKSGMKLNSWVGMALQRAAESPTSTSTGTSDTSKADELKLIKEELARIRAQGEALESTVNSISSILLKLYDNQSK